MTDLIRTDFSSPIATIQLNRAAKLNSLTPEMLDQLEAAINQVEQDRTIRVVLLTAAGEKAFCVGADINAWGALEPIDMWRQWIVHGHRVFNRVAACRLPVIAVLNGYTLGGGLELALAADIRLAADSARFALPEVKIATVPGWGGTERLPKTIGVARAKQMIFTGAQIGARTAEKWGLVNEICELDALLPRAVEMAHEIANNAPISVQMAKQLVDGDAMVALEAVAGALAAFTADGREGVSSFQEKRSPNYEDR